MLTEVWYISMDSSKSKAWSDVETKRIIIIIMMMMVMMMMMMMIQYCVVPTQTYQTSSMLLIMQFLSA